MTSETTGNVEEMVIPLLDEDISVTRRKTEREVRVHVRTTTREEHVDEPVAYETVEIERVPIGRQTDSVPPVRTEGDVTIVPVVEEVLVIEKRLMIKEEIHLRHVRRTERHRETVVLRQQQAVVERAGAQEPGAATAPNLAPAPIPQQIKEQ